MIVAILCRILAFFTQNFQTCVKTSYSPFITKKNFFKVKTKIVSSSLGIKPDLPFLNQVHYQFGQIPLIIKNGNIVFLK